MSVGIQNKKPYYRNYIPNDWEVETLNDCCIIKGEYGINAAAVNFSEDLPTYLRITDIDDDGNLSSIKKASVNDENSESFVLSEGDIVFARTGATVGKTYLYNKNDGKLVYAGFLIRFKPDVNKLSVNFLKHITNTKTYWAWVNVYSMRGGQPGINAKEYGSFKIPLPSLSEQHAIAKALGSMDQAINANNQLVAQKELRKKWLMQNLLTGKKRLKGYSGEWKEHQLGQMFAERNDRNNDGLALLSIGQNGVYPQEDSIKKDTSNSDKSKYKKICIGDIGYNTMRMWQGRSALSNLEGIVSPAYTILKPRENADALFFSYLFKTPKLVNLFWRNSQGLVGDTLNCKYKDFSIVKTMLPLKDEQIAIAQILQAADRELYLLRAKTEKLKEQKKGMMQVLLTGKKRLKIN